MIYHARPSRKAATSFSSPPSRLSESFTGCLLHVSYSLRPMLALISGHDAWGCPYLSRHHQPSWSPRHILPLERVVA
jgi:hypothetical protein